MKLTGWGIIEKAGKSAYRIDKEKQNKLIKFFRLPTKPSDKDAKSLESLTYEIGSCLCYAAWRHLRDEYRVDRSLRMLNRFFFLGLHFNGFLPPLPLSWWQELSVTALVVYSVTLIVQFLAVVVVYGATFFGVGLSVCYMLRRSNNIKTIWWQAVLISYFIYTLNNLFYSNPYLKWSVLVSPKALIPVKKVVWG